MHLRSALASLSFCLLVTSPAIAQDDPDPLWIDVNLGVAAYAQEGYTVSIQAPFRSELLRYGAEYEHLTGSSLDVGVGYMFRPRVGFGVSLLGTGHLAPARISASVPDPLVLNRPATDVSTTDRELTWSEGSVNFQAMFKLTPVDSRFVARVFGGPTYFRISQEAISDFNITESQDPSTGAFAIDLDGYEYADGEGSGWGFHLGADAGYFFTAHVGVAGIVRFSRATIDLADPLLAQFNQTVEIMAGGARAGGGLRLKF
jgi:hypothetical protein